jgi:uncharacterized membrane protein YidH (DUF202 family)
MKDAKFQMTFRDRLALARTYQAKERTILAYIRTGLAFIGVGLFIYKFLAMRLATKMLIASVFIIPGILATAFGMFKIIPRRKQRKDFEEYHMMVSDNGK